MNKKEARNIISKYMKKQKNKTEYFRMADDYVKAVDAIAKKEKCARSDIYRALVYAFLDRQEMVVRHHKWMEKDLG